MPLELDLDPGGDHADDAYKILASLVTPRPIALVTTLNADGTVNAAPFSFFNVLGADPPIVGVCPGDRPEGGPKDTALNIRRTGQFVVNLVDEAIAEAMVACAASLPYGENELEAAGLTAAPSPHPGFPVPSVAEAPAALQCTEQTTLRIGHNRVVVGRVHRVVVRDGIFDDRLRLVPENYLPVGRTYGPDGYCRTRDGFKIARPN